MPEVLDYRTPDPPTKRRAPIWEALLLCLPGAVCWGVLGMAAGGRWVFGAGVQPLVNGLHAVWPVWIVCWVAAGVTGLASVWRYWDRSKSWAMWLNLAINVPGLILTGMVLLFANGC